MKVKTVLSLLKQIKYLKSVIRHCGGSLVSGKYILFDGFRSMALDDSEILECAKKYFNKPGIDSNKAKCAALLNKISYFKNRNRNSTAEFEAFYTSNNYDKIREIKLFSFKRNKILTICTGSEEFEKQFYQYNTFGKYYNMPRICKVNKYPNSFEISMVNLITSPNESESLKTIVESTINAKGLNYDKCDFIHGYDLINVTYEDNRINDILQKIINKIDQNLLKLSIPVCIQHGDLSKDNLIYGNSEGKIQYWFIDWEHAEKRLFFYDYFFYIVNSAMYYNDDALQYYMNGYGDIVLKQFFECFGLSFHPEHRNDYFLLFMLSFLKERICDKGNIIALNKYYDFINTTLGLSST